MKLTEADARVFLTEGLLSADIEDHEEAIENYDKALEIVESVEIYLNKGVSLAELERFEEALECYDKACLLYTSPSPRDRTRSRMPSSA